VPVYTSVISLPVCVHLSVNRLITSEFIQVYVCSKRFFVKCDVFYLFCVIFLRCCLPCFLGKHL
jgi:hypothetical protein